VAKKIVEGPGTTGTISGGGDDDDGDSGRRVRPGDTVRISAPGEPSDGAVGKVLDVVAVLPENAAEPYIVATGSVKRV
jgi:hypothetical protein